MNKNIFLLLGITIGLILIFLGIFNNQKLDKTQFNIVALVNDHPILQSDLDLALNALAMNKENSITPEQVRLVLERLIDEQLLLQRGVELNLPQNSNPIRKMIINSMVDSILSENNDFQITDDVLIEFYNENIVFFLPPKELRLKKLFIKFGTISEDENRLDIIREMLIDGEDFDEVSLLKGDQFLPEIPDTYLPERKLLDYLDPLLVKNAFNLKDGQITSEIETNDGYHFLYLVDSKKGEPLPFDEMKEKVKAEYIRRSDEDALINYLNWLRDRYNVVYGEKFNE
jgi:parvulin-like peptidyl-prolyl isomerase